MKLSKNTSILLVSILVIIIAICLVLRSCLGIDNFMLLHPPLVKEEAGFRIQGNIGELLNQERENKGVVGGSPNYSDAHALEVNGVKTYGFPSHDAIGNQHTLSTQGYIDNDGNPRNTIVSREGQSTELPATEFVPNLEEEGNKWELMGVSTVNNFKKLPNWKNWIDRTVPDF